jgi:magnesium transporter
VLTIRQGAAGGFRRPAAPGPGCWLHVDAPADPDLAAVRDFGVPASLLSHVGDPDERPRVEREGPCVLVVLQVPRRRREPDGAPFVTAPFSVFVLPQGVVTVTNEPFDLLQPLLDGTVPGLTPDRGVGLLLRIFWQVADAYLAAVREINRSVERLEDELKRSIRNEEVLGLLDYQKSLTYFATAMAENEMVLERLERTTALELDAVDRDLLEDLRIEVRQAIEMVGIADDILSQMMDAFASIVSNNLNAVMKVLTSVTILVAVPSLLASLYGMNVALPGAASPLAFAGLLLACIAIAAALFVYFRRRKWL